MHQLKEHCICAHNSDVLQYICKLLNICLVFGVVPGSFSHGILIPILKKPCCDPSVPSNYRPITISTTLSKIMELHILDRGNGHEFSDCQFGFVPGRGTNMAIALAHDVITHNTEKGATIYTCSLDAEGAFDAVPHSVLLDKARTVIPDECWRLLIPWYKELKVQIKWNDIIAPPISIMTGTRQGGLSSPYLFNLFYEGVVEILQSSDRGTRMNDNNFNVFCYADDLLLSSTTATGLQHMIDMANQYIISHGLTFNPSKTKCTVFGMCKLKNRPKWTINAIELEEVDSIKYLGVTLANNSNRHVDERIRSCRRAFYALQGAGLCRKGVDPMVSSAILKAAVRPVLLYGMHCVYLNQKHKADIERAQGNI